MATRGGGAARALGWLIAVQVGPVTAAAPVEPDGAPFAAELAIPSTLSADAGFAARWVIDGEDNRGLPFAIVDKKGARLYVFAPTGRFVGESPVLLGSAMGDMSIAGVASRAPANLAPAERTTPAGRFESQPGHNARGEDIIWFDYDASLAIHRLRPSPASQRREERMNSPRSDGKRISFGCIVVPVAFYDAVVRPSLGRQRGVVYVLPETQPVAEMLLFQLRIPVAPEHVGDRHGDPGPGGDSLSHDRIDVIHVEMDRHRRYFQYLRAAHAPFGRFRRPA